MSQYEGEADHRHRTFGRAGGRPLSARQQLLVETLGVEIAVPATPPGALDPRSLFAPAPTEVWLEIGFGGGEHLASQAAAHPEVGIIGVEPFLEGVAKALGHVADAGLRNVRIRRGDARDVIDQLSAKSLRRVFILFPDPWPKARHRKRRLVQASFLSQLSRALAPAASVRFATDWADYAETALAAFLADGRFHWTAESPDDWRTPPADHITTRYQEKRLGDCAPVFLDFVFLG